MGVIEVHDLAYALPGGRTLFTDVTIRVGDGEHAALVGANGTGKTTLLRVLAGELAATGGTARLEGRVLVLRQLVPTADSRGGSPTIAALLRDLAPAAIGAAAREIVAAEQSGDGVQLAAAYQHYADAGGWDAEVEWDVCCVAALRLPFEEVRDRPLATLSGGEQKRLAMEYLLRSDADVLLLDEPDNFLDVPAKEWLETALTASPKTILLVSHDRELLARTAQKVVTLEGRGAWTHGGSFATYHEARDARLARLDDEHRRYRERRRQLEASVAELRRRSEMTDAFASRLRATKTKIDQLDRQAPRERPPEQRIAMRLGGDRTGKRAVVAEALTLTGLTAPFDIEVCFGERVGIVGLNGTGKSHFLRLLAGQAVEHSGEWRLGARVVAGYFSQTHDHPVLPDRALLDLLMDRNLTRGAAMAALRRYELHDAWRQRFATLSGGQQARVQILLLELSGATLLLLDEPTDNLDLASAEALEEALAQYEGTVLIVTHDRWLVRGCDRYLRFGRDGNVTETLVPVYS